MSRVDVPTLKCDRCERTTQDDNDMISWHQIQWYTGDSGNKKIEEDLCPGCWTDFNAFMANTVTVKRREP